MIDNYTIHDTSQYEHPLDGSFYGPSYTVDTIPPEALSIIRLDPEYTAADSVRYAVEFSEVVVGVDESDFQMVLSGITNAYRSVSGWGSDYTLTVSDIVGTGTLQVNLYNDGSIRDVINPLVAGLTGPTYKIIDVDLDTDSNNDGVIDASDDPIEEESPGRIVAVHQEGVADLAEVDIRSIGVTLPEPGVLSGTLTFMGNIRVWADQERTQEITSGASWDLYYTAQVPEVVWVEGFALGEATMTWTVEHWIQTLASDAVKLSVVKVDLDVNNNGTITDAVDGAATFLPGYCGAQQVLTPAVVQSVQVILVGLSAGATVDFQLIDTSTHKGIASNRNSDPATYPSGENDYDYVLVAPPGATQVNDQRVTDVTVNGAGKAIITMQVRDFGGRTNVEVLLDGNVIAKLQVPLDSDVTSEGLPYPDGLPDVWEDLYVSNLPDGFTAFDKTKSHSVQGVIDYRRDDDRNEGGAVGGGEGDRFTAFDEYRGFFAKDVYRRTSPVVKQIFVYAPDKDPFLSTTNNDDGLNTVVNETSPEIGIGGYADDLDAEILLINRSEADEDGYVNFNSVWSVDGKLQKMVWSITETDLRHDHYGVIWVYDGDTKGPNNVGPLPADEAPNNGKRAFITHLGKIRSDVAFIDRNGTQSLTGGWSEGFMLRRGSGDLPAHPLRDPNRHIIDDTDTVVSLFYFTADDKVRWHDTNSDGHWDRGDELWVDVDSSGTYTTGDGIIFDYDENLAVGTAGTLADNTTEFRYVRRVVGTRNTPASYASSDFIYTTHLNRDLYIATRDFILAHELGHPAELVHDPQTYSIMFTTDIDTIFTITANGLWAEDLANPGYYKYIDPPTQYNNDHQNTLLQLRE